MFQVTSNPIDVENFRIRLQDQSAGAYSSFEGRVRNHSEGRKVTALEYEAYEALCRNEGRLILEEASRRFDVMDCSCVHRIGRLNPGDIAVWVGVSATHRDAAFMACRYIIDEVKSRVPIWKKEFYTDGDASWVNAALS